MNPDLLGPEGQTLVFPRRIGEARLWFGLGCICIITAAMGLALSLEEHGTMAFRSAQMYVAIIAGYVCYRVFAYAAHIRMFSIEISPSGITADDPRGRHWYIPKEDIQGIDHSLTIGINRSVELEVPIPFETVYRIRTKSADVYVSLDTTDNPKDAIQIIRRAIMGGD